MKRHFFIAAVIPFVVFIFSTCTKDVGRPIPPPVVVQVDSCKNNVTFAQDIKPILNTYCAIPGGCHTGNPSWGDFTTHGGFQSRSSLGVTRIKNNEMPPDYSTGPKDLTACELSKLEAWVAAGSPNN